MRVKIIIGVISLFLHLNLKELFCIFAPFFACMFFFLFFFCFESPSLVENHILVIISFASLTERGKDSRDRIAITVPSLLLKLLYNDGTLKCQAKNIVLIQKKST